tara:strand:- start:904 stop:1104 length:201 start_codon:yes stop_codon:yes gene_type:complete
MRYSGGDPNLGNSGGMDQTYGMIPFNRFTPVTPQQQINQYDKLDAIRTLGNMTEAQKNGFANKHVY